MEETIKTLLYLIRIGLFADAKYQVVSSKVDWPALFTLSLKHGVGALVADGLLKLQNKVVETDAIGALNNPTLKIQMMKWVGKSLKIAQIAEKQEMVMRNLANIFAQHGLRTIVLKGIALSRCYPHPQYRYCCDFDCYLMPNHSSSFEAGNKVIEKLGLKVDRGFYKNSSFVYKGLSVENHQFCTPIRGNRRMKRFEQLLEGLLEQPTTIVEGSHLEIPDTLFTALFITEHAQAHLLENAFTLKQVCDWAVFRNKDFNKDAFENLCREYGYWKMAETMDHLADLLEGKCEYADLNFYEQKLLVSIFEQKETVEMNKRWKTRVQLIRHAMKQRWKYKAFTDIPMYKGLSQQVLGFLFDRKPTLH